MRVVRMEIVQYVVIPLIPKTEEELITESKLVECPVINSEAPNSGQYQVLIRVFENIGQETYTVKERLFRGGKDTPWQTEDFLRL